MFTSTEKFFNWSRINLLAVFNQGRGYLLLIMFFVVLLLINLVVYAIFDIENGILVFFVASLVLVGGGLIVTYAFRQTTGKGWVIFASVVLCIGAILLAPQIFARLPHHLLDRARFFMVRDEYLSKIEKAGHKNTPRFMRFPWGDADSVLVFDESGELSYPNRAKPEDWWLRAGNPSEFTSCRWQAAEAAQHFYVVNFNCS